MSARVVWGLAPAGKPHPATKWSLLIALLVVVVLGVPKIASAGQPEVQPPMGSQSDGVFTGVYTFGTYMYCEGGPDYNSSYSNNIEGTHTFQFYGAADGSLLVTIDGGGMEVVTSCGSPYSTPITVVATYTVTKGQAPSPTPTPTATPNPTPSPIPTHTPTPTQAPVSTGGGGSSSGSSHSNTNTGSSSGNSSNASGGSPSQTNPTQTSSAQTTTNASANSVTSPESPAATSSSGVKNTPDPSSQQNSPQAVVPASKPLTFAAIATGLSAVAFALLLLLGLRSSRFRNWIERRIRRFSIMVEPYVFRLRHSFKNRVPVHGIAELKRKGLSPHRHTGKLLAHHHTSYAALAFLLALSCVLAAGVSLSSRADSADSSVVSLTVLGPPPTTGATITDPTGGEILTTSPTTVRGTCPSGLFLEIWRGGTFAGDTACDVNDLYSLVVTMEPGENDLVARDVDGLGQYGPDSATVVVTYNPPPPPPSPSPSPSINPSPAQTPASTSKSTHSTSSISNSPGSSAKSSLPSKTIAPSVANLTLGSSQHFYQGADVDTAVNWTINVNGGVAPYTLEWEWGDGSKSTTNAGQAGTVQYQHTYSKPGIYQVTITATDAGAHQYVLQLVVVVDGGVASTGLGQQKGDPGNLVTVWPILTFTSLVVISLWLGEHHKLASLQPVNALRVA